VRPEPLELFWAVWGDGTRSLRAVEREFGWPRSSVQKWCVALDIPVPTHDEAMRIRALKRRADTRCARESVRRKAQEELETELDRMWAEHGCDAFLGRHGATEGAASVG